MVVTQKVESSSRWKVKELNSLFAGVECWIYILKKYKEEMLSLPMLSVYRSEDDHGRAYVPRSEREHLSNYYGDVMSQDLWEVSESIVLGINSPWSVEANEFFYNHPNPLPILAFKIVRSEFKIFYLVMAMYCDRPEWLKPII